MNTTLKIIVSVLIITNIQVVFAKNKFSSTLQTTITNGTNNGFNESYLGLWLSGKTNIGLSRNSLVSLNVKVGGQKYDESAKDKSDFGLQANYIYQPSSGYFSPTYSFKMNFLKEDFKSSTTDKTSFSVSRYKPISNKMEYGLTYRLSKKSGQTDIDTHSFILNLDYFYDSSLIFYTNLSVSDEETSTTITNSSNVSTNTAAKSADIAGGHAPGEPGYHGPALSIGNHLSNSDNTSIFLGAVYSIDSNQSVDVAYIKHFYNSNTSGTSTSSYLALDYFYKF